MISEDKKILSFLIAIIIVVLFTFTLAKDIEELKQSKPERSMSDIQTELREENSMLRIQLAFSNYALRYTSIQLTMERQFANKLLAMNHRLYQSTQRYENRLIEMHKEIMRLQNLIVTLIDMPAGRGVNYIQSQRFPQLYYFSQYSL